MADDASHIGVMPPTPGRMVRVIGPGFDHPAVVVSAPYVNSYGPLVIDVVVLQGGYARVGYLGDTGDTNVSNVVVPGTVPHKTTRDAVAKAHKPLSIGPCYWIWPTEAP